MPIIIPISILIEILPFSSVIISITLLVLFYSIFIPKNSLHTSG